MRLDKQTRIPEIPCRTKKTHTARSFSVEGPEEWNALPDDIRRIEAYKNSKAN